MTGFHMNIEAKTLSNNYFREVIYTGKYMQLVVMSLLPLEDIGMEVHKSVDQFFRFESGEGKVIMNGEETLVSDGDVIVIPAGVNHNIINVSKTKQLKLYTIYSPANHPDGIVHKTKADAIEGEKRGE